MKLFKKILLASFMLVFMLSFVACNKEENKAKEGSVKGNTIKVVATSEDYKTLFDKFTKETGIKTEVLSMSSGEVLSRVKAEGKSKMADLWFGGGIDSFMSAKKEGLLATVSFDSASKIDAEFKDVDNQWFSKGVTVVGFIVNPTLLKEKNIPEPKTWDDLKKAEYKDLIIMSNPAISGTNYAVINSILQSKGNDAGWKYFEDLNKNIKFYSKRGKDPALKVSEGEFAIGITYIDKTLDKMIEEKGLRIIYPQDGMPWIPDGVAVFKDSTNEAGAKKFIEWLYKDENLKELVNIDKKNTLKLVMPSLTGVQLDFDKEKLLKVDLKLFGEQREAILAKWKDLIGSKAGE
ncbi:ABC transporter substrate-binding protein [Clostridium cylindrosporum]|uniref:ABC-type Fe3+ transport system periplasmic component n=1 Tax=Clostridium cylindrosporum DSM 605 TaxID=1121307 RepID=A0A0J8DE11_CLOCY|nr:ABC transporter substrate-binding protein [Clostridium cylindrosporum]KMT22453.1 ABC-type Fe3+ transport system periplasmic component [Clostridium cylindrosporum DSM 605]